MKTPEILLPAMRQYQHNDCSGFLAGFDHDETSKVVNLLNKELELLHKIADEVKILWDSDRLRLEDIRLKNLLTDYVDFKERRNF